MTCPITIIIVEGEKRRTKDPTEYLSIQHIALQVHTVRYSQSYLLESSLRNPHHVVLDFAIQNRRGSPPQDSLIWFTLLFIAILRISAMAAWYQRSDTLGSTARHNQVRSFSSHNSLTGRRGITPSNEESIIGATIAGSKRRLTSQHSKWPYEHQS